MKSLRRGGLGAQPLKAIDRPTPKAPKASEGAGQGHRRRRPATATDPISGEGFFRYGRCGHKKFFQWPTAA